MDDTLETRRSSRRRFLQDAAVAGTAIGLAGAPGTAVARKRGGRRDVAVLGGGMAGLAAAHELAERGFASPSTSARRSAARRAASGCRRPRAAAAARSRASTASASSPASTTTCRTRCGASRARERERRVGQLRDATETQVPAHGGPRRTRTLFGVGPGPRGAPRPRGCSASWSRSSSSSRACGPTRPSSSPTACMVFLTSCDERRYGQWEHTTWWDFVRAEGKSDEYKKVIARGPDPQPRRRQGDGGQHAHDRQHGRGLRDEHPWAAATTAPPTASSTRRPTRPGSTRGSQHLRRLGVRFHVGQTVEALEMRRGRVVAARARDRRGRRRRIEADWFVCAMPAERARRLWSPQGARARPGLELMDELFVDWMAGIQFYLQRAGRPYPRAPHLRGRAVGADGAHPGAVLGRARLRRATTATARRSTASRSTSPTGTRPGILYGKPAKQCTRAGRSSARSGRRSRRTSRTTASRCSPTTSCTRGSSTRRSTGRRSARRNRNDDAAAGQHRRAPGSKRPQARTKIPNLFLAGDYVQTDIDLATMEGANESGRAAVNALLDAAGLQGQAARRCTSSTTRRSSRPRSAADPELFAAGRPNALDRP